MMVIIPDVHGRDLLANGHPTAQHEQGAFMFFIFLRDILEKEIERLFYSAFDYLQLCVDTGRGRLYVPSLNADSPRISEQEIRCAFIELFLNDFYFKDYSYSIETPTQLTYRFTKGSKKVIPSVDALGRKAKLDLCIFKGEARVAIIEFKANNAGSFEHGKDLIKLASEPGTDLLRFFVEIYSSTDRDTICNAYNKLFRNKYYSISNNTTFIGYSLNTKRVITKDILSCSDNNQ